MSAYAISSFSNYLSPITSTTKEVSDNECKTEVNQDDHGPEDSISNDNMEPEHKKAIRIKVKSAVVDAGVLVGPSSSKFFNIDQSYFSVPDDSVRFKLSIKFNGRKYTATRSFAKFVKLRKNLVNELCMSTNTRLKRKNISHSTCMSDEEQLSYNKAESMLPKLPASISDRVDGSCHFALPRMSSGYKMARAAASVSFNMGSGGITGFTKLQSVLLCYYSPLIEWWLIKVMDIIDVDTSTCLNNFLWEPLRGSDSIPSLSSSSNSSKSSRSSSMSRKLSSSSIRSLSSINEDIGCIAD